jgi:hypothetical protein
MMKLKHNKKRNTAFLYESLVRETTKTIMDGDIETRQRALQLFKEHFAEGTCMRRELDLYKSMLETQDLHPRTAERLLEELKKSHEKINKKELFNEQTKFINKINKEISKSVFNNFVPNYKNLATVYQIFNNIEMPTKDRVLLEESAIAHMSFRNAKKEKTKDMKPVDDLVYKSFVEKFNSSYSTLFENQKKLLYMFINSVDDESNLRFKLYLNEEIGRLKKDLSRAPQSENIEDSIKEKTKDVSRVLEGFCEKNVDDKMLTKILKIQELVKEIKTNVD